MGSFLRNPECEQWVDIPFTAISKFCLTVYTLVMREGLLRLTKDQFLEREAGVMQHYNLVIDCYKYFEFDKM